jgi:hypothetical protein
MDKPTPDISKVRREFIRGGNHPDDVDGMFNLYQRFRQVSYMQKAYALGALLTTTWLCSGPPERPCNAR